MEGDLFREFKSSVEKSKHSELICGGLNLFNRYMNGESCDLVELEQPLKKSVHIFSDEVENYLQGIIPEIMSEDEAVSKRFLEKYAKHIILNLIGEKLPPEEEQQLQNDSKYILRKTLESIDVI
jgi:hypothetical protein